MVLSFSELLGPTMYEECLAGSLVVVLVHLVGFVLLYKTRSQLPNQRLLILNLALVEVLCGCYMLVIFSVVVSGIEWRTSFGQYAITFCETLLYTRIRFTVLHIILDRFLEIYMNMKYPIYMTRRVMVVVLTILWFLSVVSALISVILKTFLSKYTAHKFALMSMFTLDVIIFTSATITYIYFFKTTRRIRTLDSIASGRKSPSMIGLFRERFLLPCYIVCTYMLFNLSSIILATVSRYVERGSDKVALTRASYVLDMVGFTSDAAIYVFANKSVRKFLQSLIRDVKREIDFKRRKSASFVIRNGNRVIKTEYYVYEILSSV